MTRRFEYSDATSHKFWEVTVSGKTVTVRFGRIGTDGQTQIKDLDSPAVAKAAAAKQVAEKLKKGYQEVGAAPAAPKAAAPRAGAKSAAREKAVDPKQLVEVRRLLGQEDAAAVRQGIALLQALDNPALWATLATGVTISKTGFFEFAKGCELEAHVTRRFRKEVALWVLWATRKLANVRHLDLSASTLQSLDVLEGCPRLQTLDLSYCDTLASLQGLEHCPQLRTLTLYGDLDVVADLDRQGLIVHDWAGWLPIAMPATAEWDAYDCDQDHTEKALSSLRDHLGTPTLERIHLRKPKEEEIANAKRDGWSWNPKTKTFVEVEEEEEEEEEEDW